jgi:DNA-binding response OmpR family regulator
MKVLVVEDDEDIRDLVLAVLRRARHTVTAEDNGRTGLATALAERPDLVVLDWNMPGLTGLEVCRALRADPRTMALPVLLLTSRTQELDIDQAFAAGADDYMVKPFRGGELVSRVATLLARGTGVDW